MQQGGCGGPLSSPTLSEPQHHPALEVFQAINLLLVVILAETPPPQFHINQPRLFQHESHGEVDLFRSNTGSFQINTNCSPKLLNSLNCSPLLGNHLRQFNKMLASKRQLQIDKVFETRLISLLSGKCIRLKPNEEDKQPCPVRKTPPATELLNLLFQRCSYCLERALTLLKQGSRLQHLEINSRILPLAEKKTDFIIIINNSNNRVNVYARCDGKKEPVLPFGVLRAAVDAGASW